MRRVYCDKCGTLITKEEQIKCNLQIGLFERRFDLCKKCRPEVIEEFRKILAEAYKKGEM